MKHYKIEKGIKLSAPTTSTASAMTSPAVETMNLLSKGDSFLIKDALDAVHGEKKMRDMNSRQRENGGGRVFASRRMRGGVRIWRVK